MTSSPSAVRAGMPPRVPPVAPGSFLLGSARELRRDMLGACEQAFHQYGDVVRLLVGPPGLRLELYLLSHPDAMQRVLASSWRNYRKENVFYSEVRGAFGDGVLTSQDGEWQRQMRFLQPLFTAKRVAGYAAVMSEQVQDLAQQWRLRPAGMVDLHDEMTRLTLRIVCRVLFGADPGQPATGPRAAGVARRLRRDHRPTASPPRPAGGPGRPAAGRARQ